MAGLPCSVPDCPYNTDSQVGGETELQDKSALLKIHTDGVHKTAPAPVQCPASAKAKINPRKLYAGSDMQAWDQFIARWKIFKTTMGITEQSSPMWLFNCLDSELQANPGTDPHSHYKRI